MQTVCPLDIRYLPDAPLSVRFEFAFAGPIGFGRYEGTMSEAARRPRDVAADPAPAFHLSFNIGPSLLQYDTSAKEVAWTGASLALSNTGMPANLRSNDLNGFQGISIPQQILLARVPNAEDLSFTVLPATGATRLLRGYIDILSGLNDFSDDLALSDHVETTLLDLAVLALGARGDENEIARMRGLRAARARMIVAEIRKGFADPAFSPALLAHRLGLSARYINKLMQETEVSFTERLLELRLQKTLTMLKDPRQNHTKVSDIALTCGFSDISYFNRCFRRRFGASPIQYRGGNGKNGHETNGHQD